jgi:hypothetical protein
VKHTDFALENDLVSFTHPDKIGLLGRCFRKMADPTIGGVTMIRGETTSISARTAAAADPLGEGRERPPRRPLGSR